jgi:hypothetical protein
MSGVIPAGAEGLSPFLAARSVELSQTIEGGTEGLVPGESVTRTVTATIRGTSPMFLPSLLADHRVEGMRAYANDPIVETQGSGGDVSGTRVEKVTLIAEGVGSGMAPAVELEWFDLDTGTLQTARIDAFPLSVVGPPAASATAAQEGPDLRDLAVLATMGLVCLTTLLLMLRYALPRARRLLSAIRQRWRHSEPQGWIALRRVIRQRDYAGLRPAIDTWTRRLDVPYIARDPSLQRSLTGLGEARYGSRTGPERQDWQDIERRLRQLRRAARASLGETNLPPLNRTSCPSSEFSGMLGPFPNGGSGSFSVQV